MLFNSCGELFYI